jgi:murein lipoprotein
MLTKKISVFSFSLIAAIAMAGCSNTGMLEQKITNLTAKVDNLSTKVDSLSTEVTGFNAQQELSDEMVDEINLASEHAAMEAKRANDRITNMVKSYKK